MKKVVGPHENFNTFKVRHLLEVRDLAGLLVLLVGLFLLVPLQARAQEFRGTISGTVTDSTGAVIPGAQVVIRETATGTTSKTVSNNSGQYVVPFLLPGNYSITAEKKGFKTSVRKGIALNATTHLIIRP